MGQGFGGLGDFTILSRGVVTDLFDGSLSDLGDDPVFKVNLNAAVGMVFDYLINGG